jgi:hypothetical protein
MQPAFGAAFNGSLQRTIGCYRSATRPRRTVRQLGHDDLHLKQRRIAMKANEYSIVVCVLGLLFVAVGLASCSREKPQNIGSTQEQPVPTREQPVAPVEYTLTAIPEKLPNGDLRLGIKTNIPGTIEVMAAVSLHGQKGDDTYIGKDERVRIANGQGQTTFSTDDLPRGNYDVEVKFYPRWGFQDAASRSTGISKDLTTSSPITLGGSGVSAADVQFKENGQKWVMEHVAMGDPWHPAEWVQRFGKYRELTVDAGQLNPNVIKAYYFPRIDMTILVSVMRGQITIWRVGQAHS